MKKVISLVSLVLAALMLLASCTPAAILGVPLLLPMASPEETISEQTTPDANTPENTTPEETSPEATTPEETPPEETMPEETTPEETTPEETTPEETTPEEIEPETPAPMPKKILAIGNSFSVDAMQHLWEILIGEGYTDFVLGNLYIGGCTIDTHKAHIDAGDDAYTFYTNTGSGWKNAKASIQTGLTYTDWDVITVQQASGYSGLTNSFGNLQYVVDYARNTVNNPDVKIYWHMTWAYQGNSNHGDFAKYGNNQKTMYSAIVNAVKEKVLTNTSIDGVLPCGTAIQNLRTSYFGDTLTRDGYHLSEDIGRYAAALVWYKKLMGADLTDLTVVPTPFPDVARHLPVIKEAVNNAIRKPYTVTNATVTGPTAPEPTNPFLEMTEDDIAYLEGRGLDPNDYEVLDLGLTFWGYYFSNLRPAATLAKNESNSPQYIATTRFTSQTMPTGSIVHVLDGYKYRLEGWQKLGTKNALGRLDNSTSDMTIGATLYNNYKFLAFNISRTDGKTVTYDDGWGLRIYVPKAPEADLSMTDGDRAYLSGLGLNPDDYEKLDLDYTLFAYYFSTGGWKTTMLTAKNATENNLINFISTRLISKDEMPIGSVIRIDDGYQFRPERFVGMGIAPEQRADNVFSGVIVDEAWWGNYQLAGFNVSQKGASADFVASTETGTHFVIYVPKTN